MNKLILMFVMVFLMVGVVGADRVISDLDGIDVPIGSVVAGSPFEAVFSFNYFDAPMNEDDSPLIIQLNVTSKNESYPVGKGEFVISGVAKRYAFFGMIPIGEVKFNCSEEYEQTIEHPKDAQDVIAENGTFYCYNEEGDLSLNERDEITLTIVSHYAIYPGEYELSAKLFYLTDERAPFVNITNKDLFKRYYREIDSVEILATIDDGSDIVEKWGMAFLGYDNLTFPWTHEDSGVHYFSRNTPVDIAEGYYPLYVFAEDEYGNEGNDSVTLKIDRSAPEIVLVLPNATVGKMFWITANVTDAKAGVDNSSVEYKLKDKGCDDGANVPDCYNSGWLPLYHIGGDLYGVEINATEIGLDSGSYNLQIRASDVLGNEGVLE